MAARTSQSHEFIKARESLPILCNERMPHGGGAVPLDRTASLAADTRDNCRSSG